MRILQTVNAPGAFKAVPFDQGGVIEAADRARSAIRERDKKDLWSQRQVKN